VSRLPIRVRMTGAFALAMVLVLVAAALFVLAIVGAIAEAHGGTAAIVQDAAGTTTVRLRLPPAPRVAGARALSPVSGKAGTV
jgi:hypothetical protein